MSKYTNRIATFYHKIFCALPPGIPKWLIVRLVVYLTLLLDFIYTILFEGHYRYLYQVFAIWVLWFIGMIFIPHGSWNFTFYLAGLCLLMGINIWLSKRYYKSVDQKSRDKMKALWDKQNKN